MLATGRPRGAPESATVRERIEAAKAEQERIRRRPGRKAWVPNQHGAYSMLVLPPVIGWIVGGFSWVNLLLLPAWWDAYLTYWAWSQWLRTRSSRRPRYGWRPGGAWGGRTRSCGWRWRCAPSSCRCGSGNWPGRGGRCPRGLWGARRCSSPRPS